MVVRVFGNIIPGINFSNNLQLIDELDIICQVQHFVLLLVNSHFCQSKYIFNWEYTSDISFKNAEFNQVISSDATVLVIF